MIDISRMTPVNLLTSDTSEVGLDIADLAVEARDYLLAHDWCVDVRGLYFDRGFPNVAVFFADVEPSGDADPQIWVIVGDVPPLYIDTVDQHNGAEALAGYVVVLTDLIDFFNQGQSLSGMPPLLTRRSLEPLILNSELANMLSSRLALIAKTTLSLWKNEIDSEMREALLEVSL